MALELGERGVPTWSRVDGSMLSADISGFTALSERLAGKGKAGAEELNRLMSACFTALIDAAYRYDGEVLKFGGDAVLVLFRGERHERRAASAGLDMQRALSSSAAAKQSRLAMTVGIADGPFDMFVVGDRTHHLLPAGPRSTEVIRLESAARLGETLVTTSIAEHLPPEVCVGSLEGGVLIDGSIGEPETTPAPRGPVPDTVAAYVAGPIVEQYEGFASLGGEHRLVAIGFVFVGGVDALLARDGHGPVAEALAHVVDGVIEACDRYGVTALDTDIAADGVKFILCAGAPVNHGDTADAMLQAALRISAIDAPFVLRQGVQSGRVYAGFLGHPHRRAYTVMGDPVNTAARMLGPCRDREVVAVATVLDGTRAVFRSDPLPPFHVKGKSEPIDAHVVRAVTDLERGSVAGARLVGRDSELDAIAEALDGLRSVVEIVGTPGVGKSRLLAEAQRLVGDARVYRAGCTPYGAASPYSVFRPLLRGGTGIPLDVTPADAGEFLRERVSDVAPELLPMLPLLAAPFGATVPPTPEVSAIDPQFLRERIHDVVVEFLDAAVTGPAVLIVEDAHWIDAASGDLLDHLVRAAAGRPWTAIVTRRPEGGEPVAPDAEHVVRVTLEPLADAAIRALAAASSTRPLTDRDLDNVAQRAQGNPLFAIELARALSDGADDLPGSIEQIIASRLDRLDPAARRLVRVASVLGNEFEEDLVRSMLDHEHHRTDFRRAIRTAEAAAAVSRKAAGTWTFHHALYRDTAYEGLPFSRRRELHRMAAVEIERRSRDQTAAAPLLSLHYAAAGAHTQAWHYSILAGRNAEQQNAPDEAVAAYDRARTAAARCPDVTRAERARVCEVLGDLYSVLARADDAERAYRQARRANTDPVVAVGLIRKLGSVFALRGDNDRALDWFARAARAIPAGSDPTWSLARAHVALAEAGVRALRGENLRCFELAEAARAEAEAAGDERVRAHALERMHVALTYLPGADAEETGTLALEAYRALDDHTGIATVSINLGVEAYFDSRWTEASAHYLAALEAAQRSGSALRAANAAINSAEVLSDQGWWQRALDLLAEADRNCQAIGYRPGVAATRLFAGVAAMRAGRLDEAAEQMASARELLEKLHMTEMIDELDSRELELDLRRGAVSRERCDELADRFGQDHPCVPRVRRVRGIAEHLAGEHDAALVTLTETLAACPAGGFERALTLRALLLVAPGDGLAPAWEAEAAAIERALGVVVPAPFVDDGTTTEISSAPR